MIYAILADLDVFWLLFEKKSPIPSGSAVIYKLDRVAFRFDKN